MSGALDALTAALGDDALRTGDALGPYLHDATEVRGHVGFADAVVLPRTTDDVAATVRWAYEHGVPLTVRGGGTGYAGGAVPQGGVVLSLERLNRVRSFDPLLWRMEVEAGVTTRDVQRLARENGLLFPPDPGAAEQSHIGGNIATNAGGPHAFKYGVTGAWVTGIEAVLPPGDLVRFGGPVRKDVSTYDLRGLLVGSEGTLGVITAAWLRFIPAPEAAYPIVALYPDVDAGYEALQQAMVAGPVPGVLDYLDEATVEISGSAFPGDLGAGAGFMLIAEVDGQEREAREALEAMREALAPGALAVHSPTDRSGIEAVWRWREGVPIAVDAWLGGKISEDIAVPLDRFAEAVAGTREIGHRHGLAACSWGHAGDGNLHSSFLFDRADGAALEAAAHAAEELFALAAQLGGSLSGEHGVGLVKSGVLSRLWPPAAGEHSQRLKALLDPKGLLTPHAKRP